MRGDLEERRAIVNGRTIELLFDAREQAGDVVHRGAAAA